MSSLLQRDESRAVGGTNTRATVLDWLVGNGEFAQVVSNHFGLGKSATKHNSLTNLDFDTVENLAVIYTDNTANHLRNNDHVSAVCLNHRRLLSSGGFPLLQQKR